MTGLEPATPWSQTRCATICATSLITHKYRKENFEIKLLRPVREEVRRKLYGKPLLYQTLVLVSFCLP